MKLSALLFFIYLASDCLAAVKDAEQSCTNLRGKFSFTAATGAFQTSQEMVELTATEISKISKHKIFQHKAIYKNGKKLVFVSRYFSQSTVMELQKGESIYAKKVQEILLNLFPEATFAKNTNSTGRKKVVKIDISDPAETFKVKWDQEKFNRSISSGKTIPMFRLKTVTNWRVNTSRPELREAFGLDNSNKIIHLYIQHPKTITNSNDRFRQVYSTELPNSLKILRDKFPFQQVIITFGNANPRTVGKVVDWSSSGIYHAGVSQSDIAYLSQDIATTKLADAKIIANDTRGIMPILHRASDLSVVVGPVNFFEPLSIGTPTIIVKTSGQNNYHQRTYDQLTNLAQKRGALVVDGIDGIQTINSNDLKHTKVNNQISHNTEFTKLLNAIDKHLSNSLAK